MLFAPGDRIAKVPGLVWHVARTKPRCEKKLAEYCQRCGVACYLPLRRSVRRYDARVFTFMVPIFSGYVFVQIEPTRRPVVVESRHIATLIVPEGAMEDALVGELNDVLILERAQLAVELIVRPEIEVGRLVTIRTGALAGLRGIVSRRKSKARLAVNVEMVGQSVSIELDVGEVEIEY